MERWEELLRKTGPADRSVAGPIILDHYAGVGFPPPEIHFCASPAQAITLARAYCLPAQGKDSLDVLKALMVPHDARWPGYVVPSDSALNSAAASLQLATDRWMAGDHPRMMMTTADFSSGDFSSAPGFLPGRMPDTADLVFDLGQHNDYSPLADACGMLFLFDRHAFVCERVFVRMTDVGSGLVLHCEEGPAISYSDGFTVWAWNGVPVPKEIITLPAGSIGLDDVLMHTNMEEIQVLLARAGDAVWQDKRVKIVDHDQDRQGNQRRLARINLHGRTLQRVLVECPSTGRKYALAVPPNVQSCRDAVAWTFAMPGEEYEPGLER